MMGETFPAGYYWGTAAQADEIIKEANAQGGGMITMSKKASNKKQSECISEDDDDDWDF
jgi:hypothetical protein